MTADLNIFVFVHHHVLNPIGTILSTARPVPAVTVSRTPVTGESMSPMLSPGPTLFKVGHAKASQIGGTIACPDT
jgi:hypothetical protein